MIFPIDPFNRFVQSSPVIPKFYWDVYSSEQRWKEICVNLKKLIEYADTQTEAINMNREDIEELKRLFQKFVESGFSDYYKQLLQEWIENNLAYLYQQLCTQVFFGITSDGHFCAYVPESYSDITFDTGMIYGTEEYGRLILRYDVDGSGVIDNMSRVSNLPVRVEALEDTCYTPLTEGE